VADNQLALQCLKVPPRVSSLFSPLRRLLTARVSSQLLSLGDLRARPAVALFLESRTSPSTWLAENLGSHLEELRCAEQEAAHLRCYMRG